MAFLFLLLAGQFESHATRNAHKRPNMKNSLKTRRAFSLTDLLAVIAVMALLVGLMVPALPTPQQSAQTIKDATQITQIHQAFMIYASERTDGTLPIPGLINRLAAQVGGQAMQLQGQGNEDYAKNNSANLYSSCIAKEIITTSLVIGPTEVNPIVVEKRDYNFTQYNPSADKYWDSTFMANIYISPGGTNPFCHTSYAHQGLFGLRKKFSWRNTSDSTRPLVATRGTKNGATTGDDYTRSPTLRLHGTKEKWDGNVCFADNHTHFLQTFFPDGVGYQCGAGSLTQDNIYKCEFTDCGPGVSGAAAGDAYLGITIGAPQQNAGACVADALIW